MTADASNSTDASITDVPARQRFEARSPAGEVVGFTAYQRDGDVVAMTHTEVDDAYEGQGVASRLVRVALDQMRVQGLQIDPQCPYVASWIKRHADYQDLVVSS